MKKNNIYLTFAGVVFGLVLVLGVPDSAPAQGKGGGKGKAATRKNKGDKHRRKPSKKPNKPIRMEKKDRSAKQKAESKRFRGLAKKIDLSPAEARAWYLEEKEANPDLTYGQFVAANMIARKHGKRNPRLTTEAILDKLRAGKSLGRAVKDLGLKDKVYKRTKDRINRDLNDDDWDDNRDDGYDYRIDW